MKNKEKYFDEIIESFTSDECTMCDFKKNYVLGRRSYIGISCVKCCERTKEWLEAEYQEPITLTDDEKAILKNINKKWKWIARDRSDSLYVYNTKPIKSVSYDEWQCHEYSNINAFKHLFKFIKWEDDEPYNIDELLKQNGAERWN